MKNSLRLRQRVKRQQSKRRLKNEKVLASASKRRIIVAYTIQQSISRNRENQ